MVSDFRFKRTVAIDAKPLTILFEGKPLSALTGETVAAALLANGIDFNRTTPVSGSPRGPYCMMGTCFDCLVEINQMPNRQACVDVVSPGMEVRRMHGAREVVDAQ